MLCSIYHNKMDIPDFSADLFSNFPTVMGQVADQRVETLQKRQNSFNSYFVNKYANFKPPLYTYFRFSNPYTKVFD